MITDQLRELQITQETVFDLYMTTSDILGLIASISVGHKGAIPDLIADAEHLKNIVNELNRISVEAGKPPICAEFENSSPAQIITSVILYSRRIKPKYDLSWLDEVEKLTQ